MSDFIPPEVIHDILVNLPPKYLKTCSAVCKSWRSLIRNTAFINHHLRLHKSNAQSDLLMICSEYQVNQYAYWLHDPSNAASTGLMIPSLLFDPFKCFSSFSVRGTCNGLICISAVRKKESQTGIDVERIIIWNPCIRKYITLPRPSLSRTDGDMVKCVFVSDLRANDYKVLRIKFVNFGKFVNMEIGPNDLEVKVEVYSLAQGCWKSLTAAANIPRSCFWCFVQPVYLNGALHWFRSGFQGRDCNVIISFDVFNEQFSEMLVPQGLAPFSIDCISRYGESLACVSCPNSDGKNFVFHIWVMTNYGVIESWTEMFTVHLTFVSIPHLDGNGDDIQIPEFWTEMFTVHLTEDNVMESRVELYLPYLGVLPEYFPYAIGITRNGEILFSVRSKRLISERGLLSVDLKSGQAKTIGAKALSHRFVDSFVESLVLLDEANAVSY